ncbi:MAG: DUF6616 family protein [Tropicimonas sp.]|uniref:DUF6616 family protein n=1 Tax=Tropicimonas sp. TaxID=2067044 RepID=UPI003A87FAC9
MPHYLAETYSPKPAWQALGTAQKQAFFEQVGAGMPALLALGIEPLAFCATDGSKPHAGAEAFFALWCCPDEAALDALLAGIAQTGWHDYFVTRNLAGAGEDISAHLARLAGQAGRPSGQVVGRSA